MSTSQVKTLSEETIVDAAVRISEADGYEAISMRQLADEFGVTAMALYGYVSTKQHLLELVADRYVAELDLAEEVTDWKERVSRVLHSLYDLLLERPVLAEVLTHQTVEAPATYRMADLMLGMLREHGFSDEEAVETFHVLVSYTLGMALSRRPRIATKRELGTRARRLQSAEEYPNLAAVAELFVNWEDSDFERGLQQLIDARAKGRKQ
jgi:AcrR family transcriptional regulator